MCGFVIGFSTTLWSQDLEGFYLIFLYLFIESNYHGLPLARNVKVAIDPIGAILFKDVEFQCGWSQSRELY